MKVLHCPLCGEKLTYDDYGADCSSCKISVHIQINEDATWGDIEWFKHR